MNAQNWSRASLTLSDQHDTGKKENSRNFYSHRGLADWFRTSESMSQYSGGFSGEL
jgi:hypothetical protein